MAACANDQWSFLTSAGPVLETRKVVGQYLNCVEEIIEILNFGDRPEATKRRADPLPYDGTLANAGVGNAKLTELFLKSCEALVHVADLAYIFTESEDT